MFNPRLYEKKSVDSTRLSRDCQARTQKCAPEGLYSVMQEDPSKFNAQKLVSISYAGVADSSLNLVALRI